jgi:hypothetical protein
MHGGKTHGKIDACTVFFRSLFEAGIHINVHAGGKQCKVQPFLEGPEQGA